MKLILKLSVMGLFFGTANAEYDVLDRFKVLEDKIGLAQEFQGPGRDFFFDVDLTLNKNVFDFKDDAEKAGKTKGSNSEKLEAAQGFLKKYDKTEQSLRLNVGLGFPLPKLNFGVVKWMPRIKAGANFGVHLGVRTNELKPSDVVEYLGSDVPQSIKDALSNNDNFPSPGEDILSFAVNEGLITQAEADACEGCAGKYLWPEDTTVPDLFTYLKLDIRAGLYNDFKFGENFFGAFNLYGLHRTDLQSRVNANIIASGEDLDVFEDAKDPNSQLSLISDIRFGGKFLERYRAWVGVDEIKLTTVSDKKNEGRELNYDYDPLIKGQIEGDFQLMFAKLTPFVGFHKRKGYDFAQGLYLGSTLKMNAFSDMLGVNLLAMADKEHFTLAPRFNILFLELGYRLKLPLSSTIDDVEVATLHSVDLRLAF